MSTTPFKFLDFSARATSRIWRSLVAWQHLEEPHCTLLSDLSPQRHNVLAPCQPLRTGGNGLRTLASTLEEISLKQRQTRFTWGRSVNGTGMTGAVYLYNGRRLSRKVFWSSDLATNQQILLKKVSSSKFTNLWENTQQPSALWGPLLTIDFCSKLHFLSRLSEKPAWSQSSWTPTSGASNTPAKPLFLQLRQSLWKM